MSKHCKTQIKDEERMKERKKAKLKKKIQIPNEKKKREIDKKDKNNNNNRIVLRRFCWLCPFSPGSAPQSCKVAWPRTARSRRRGSPQPRRAVSGRGLNGSRRREVALTCNTEPHKNAIMTAKQNAVGC